MMTGKILQLKIRIMGNLIFSFLLEKTEKHQENEVNDEEFN
jgi:hypothetical protein